MISYDAITVSFSVLKDGQALVSKDDHQRGAAQLACMMDRSVRFDDFEALLGRLKAKADAAWAKAKAATMDHEIILEAAGAA
jgi:hypothetical protein